MQSIKEFLVNNHVNTVKKIKLTTKWNDVKEDSYVKIKTGFMFPIYWLCRVNDFDGKFLHCNYWISLPSKNGVMELDMNPKSNLQRNNFSDKDLTTELTDDDIRLLNFMDDFLEHGDKETLQKLQTETGKLTDNLQIHF